MVNDHPNNTEHDERRDDLVRLTCDLVRFASDASQSRQIAAAMDYVTRYLGAIPGLHVYPSESNGKPAIVATLRETRTPALLLNGHLDVIAARPELFTPQVQQGRIYGRGTQDMKGSVAVMLRLLGDLARLDPRPDVGVQLVSDEEIGGEHGTGRLLAEGWRCGCFIAVEPTDLRICYEQKGVLWVELQFQGVSAHGSRPWEGNNPLFAIGEGLERLKQQVPPLQHEAWQTTMTPTSIQTDNTAKNQIPRRASLMLDIRHTPEDTPDGLLARVRQCFPTAELRSCKRAVPLVTNPDEPALRSLAEVVGRVRGEAATLYREHFGSDARFYSAAGIPSVCFGPVGAGMHSDEEWVTIDSLVQLYQILWQYCRTYQT